MKSFDVIIIGGGLAGLTAAVHLAKAGFQTVVIEKQKYPHHKVCGEYVSNEIIPYLQHLGIRLPQEVQINTLELSTREGTLITAPLPLGGIGISRYAFDYLLYQKAQELGVFFVFDRVTEVSFSQDYFTVYAGQQRLYKSALVIGAYGKRALLDKQLNRSFIHKKSAWIGVKAHYHYDAFPKHKVALHNFDGGYAGLSKTETGAVNCCYLASYKSFKQEKDITAFNANVVSMNPHLETFLKEATPIFKTPLTIAQISFHAKQAVEGHILMCGDTAGLIHPLCGNGMAMAIHAAKIASECIISYLSTPSPDRIKLEKNYQTQWRGAFQNRLVMGRQLQNVLLNQNASALAMTAVGRSPWLLQQLIKRTHGTPITC